MKARGSFFDKFYAIFVVVLLIITFEVVLILLSAISGDSLIMVIISMIASYLIVLLFSRKFLINSTPISTKLSNPIILYIRIALSTLTFSLLVTYLFAALNNVFPATDVEIEFHRIIENNLWYGFIMTLVIAPIFEEILFRRYILTYLQKSFNPRWALVISALMFGAFHLNVRQAIYASLFGLMLGVIYQKTGKLRYPMFMHFCFNLYGMFPIFLSAFEKARGQEISLVTLNVGFIMLLALCAFGMFSFVKIIWPPKEEDKGYKRYV